MSKTIDFWKIQTYLALDLSLRLHLYEPCILAYSPLLSLAQGGQLLREALNN